MPAPPPEPVAAASGERRRRGPLLLIGALVILLLIGGGARLLLSRPAPVAVVDPTGIPTATPTATAALTSSPAPTATPTASTAPATPTEEPTPIPGDVFDHYEVYVTPGDYTIYQLDGSGNVVEARGASFDGFSKAVVTLVESPQRSWLIQNGDYAGYSYVAGDSGDFRIRKVYRGPNGERRSEYLPDDQR
jgi:hypothetical protein